MITTINEFRKLINENIIKITNDELSETINKLNQSGGKVYRLVVVPSENDIKINDIGNHWTAFEKCLPHIYEYVIKAEYSVGNLDHDFADIPFDQMKVYLITAITPPNNVDIISTKVEGTEFDEEGRIILKNYEILKNESIVEYNFQDSK